MRNFLLILGSLLLTAASADAGSWVFERSYYSHHPTANVETHRRSVGGPFYSRPMGAHVRSGYRNIRTTIIANGRVYETGQFFESWIQDGTQF